MAGIEIADITRLLSIVQLLKLNRGIKEVNYYIRLSRRLSVIIGKAMGLN